MPPAMIVENLAKIAATADEFLSRHGFSAQPKNLVSMALSPCEKVARPRPNFGWMDELRPYVGCGESPILWTGYRSNHELAVARAKANCDSHIFRTIVAYDRPKNNHINRVSWFR